jgi:hypothetical protein
MRARYQSNINWPLTFHSSLFGLRFPQCASGDDPEADFANLPESHHPDWGFLAANRNFSQARTILNRYRRAVKRQRADEAKISSPHIRHFGLNAKPRFAPDM